MSKIIRSEDAADCKAWPVPEMRGRGKSVVKPMTAGQLEEIHQQTRREGFEQGLKEGREAGLKEYTDKIACLDQLIRSLDRPLELLDESVEQQLVELAMLVARQLVRRELQSEPEQVIGVVREALAALPVSARDVQLAVNPEDAALVRDALSLHEGSHTIRITDDPVQARGGCRVLTENSQIDATVESRINAVVANVLGGLRSSDIQDS